jgi:hypothetical protein
MDMSAFLHERDMVPLVSLQPRCDFTIKLYQWMSIAISSGKECRFFDEILLKTSHVVSELMRTIIPIFKRVN